MWLLDANLDIHIVELLKGFQIDCDTAENRGWKALRNGELVAAAVHAGFHHLLTKDLLFAESASQICGAGFPTLAWWSKRFRNCHRSVILRHLHELGPSRRYTQ
jgi:hypothetical protein